MQRKKRVLFYPISQRSLTLLFLLTVFIVIASLVVILHRLSTVPLFFQGLATFDTGVVNITIVGNIDINLVEPANVDFGSGTLLLGGANTSLNTSDTVYGGNANPTTFANPGPFTVRNDGNAEVTLSVNSSNTAATFIGGTNPGYYFMPSGNPVDEGCGNNMTNNASPNSFSSTAVVVCDNLTFSDAEDTVNISIFLDVPSDATAGLKTDSGFEVHAVQY